MYPSGAKPTFPLLCTSEQASFLPVNCPLDKRFIAVSGSEHRGMQSVRGASMSMALSKEII